MSSAQPPQPAGDQQTVQRQKTRITVAGAVVNLLLAGLKVVFGVVGHSQALVVDGIHSLSDLVSDALVLVAAHTGSWHADEGHPYGHARFETAATVVIGVVLLMVAGGFAYDAVLRLVEPERLWVPGWIVLPAVVASVLAKEAVYRYTAHVGRRVGSRLIEANAWHHRSDALSSLVVLVGFAGTVAGLPWFDAVAALVVAAMVGTMGAQFAWQSVQELVDTGLDMETVRDLAGVIDSVDGVRSHHHLRTRLMADEVLIDVHILVEPWVSVSEGHRIGEVVARRLRGHLERAAEVLVHVDAERLDVPERRRAPLRGQVLSDLRESWQDIPQAGAAESIILHYRGESVHPELHVPADVVSPGEMEPLVQRLQGAADGLGYLGLVDVRLTRPRANAR